MSMGKTTTTKTTVSSPTHTGTTSGLPKSGMRRPDGDDEPDESELSDEEFGARLRALLAERAQMDQRHGEIRTELDMLLGRDLAW